MKELSEKRPVKEKFSACSSNYKGKSLVKRSSTPHTPIIPVYDDPQWRMRPKKTIVEDDLMQQEFSGELNFSELQQKFIDDLNNQRTPTCFNRKISPTLAQLRFTPGEILFILTYYFYCHNFCRFFTLHLSQISPNILTLLLYNSFNCNASFIHINIFFFFN